MCFPEVQEHPQAHTLKCPSLRRRHSDENLPYNIMFHIYYFHQCLPNRIESLDLKLVNVSK
jgi:hypothetical protein